MLMCSLTMLRQEYIFIPAQLSFNKFIKETSNLILSEWELFLWAGRFKTLKFVSR